jgi:hypothetical protein
METVTLLNDRPLQSVPGGPKSTEATRTLAVTATYVLTEEGRKASLLAAGDGRAVQELVVEVPSNRLHLVSVDANGVARLKLRPRYRVGDDQRVARADSPPEYDSPPSIEDLFREAARNHQLESTFEAERRTARSQRRESERESRAAVAQAFLSDPNRRALEHPPPTPKRCSVATEHGRMLFDADTDTPPARDVPPEAHRRFRADLRARKDRNQQGRAAQLALHGEKKRFIAKWIATHGTVEQQDRQAAGMLPIDEALEALADEAFAVLSDRPRYARDGVSRLQAHLRQDSRYADAIVTAGTLSVTSTNAVKATAAQWALVKELQALIQGATVTLRVHRLAWTHDLRAQGITAFGVLVTVNHGPFTLRREYAAEIGNLS